MEYYVYTRLDKYIYVKFYLVIRLFKTFVILIISFYNKKKQSQSNISCIKRLNIMFTFRELIPG